MTAPFVMGGECLKLVYVFIASLFDFDVSRATQHSFRLTESKETPRLDSWFKPVEEQSSALVCPESL